MNQDRMSLLVVIGLAAVAAVALGQNPCDNPKTPADRIACVGQELRQTDKKINEVYKDLATRLSADGKKQLRNEQRAWLKARTTTCKLDDKEANRERWMQKILADYSTTLCVVRLTNQRINELEAYLPAADDNSKPLPTEESYAEDTSDEYQLFTSTERSAGKWYFEVWFDKPKIAATAEVAIWVEVKSDESAGDFVTIRKRDRTSEPLTVGIAADLDNGMVYIREDGDWSNGEPGTSKGIEIKLNRAYQAGVDSSVSLADLMKKGLVKVNFGKERFAYSLPNGYKPFAER